MYMPKPKTHEEKEEENAGTAMERYCSATYKCTDTQAKFVEFHKLLRRNVDLQCVREKSEPQAILDRNAKS